MRSSDPRRVLLIRCPSIRLGEKQRPALVYLAGALVSRCKRPPETDPVDLACLCLLDEAELTCVSFVRRLDLPHLALTLAALAEPPFPV